jgi:hypothetical protein
MRPILSGGGSFPLKEMDNISRQEDNDWQVQRGNHMSAKKQIAKVRPMVRDEVKWGFPFPLPMMALRKLPRCSLAPFGMINQ